MNPTILDTGPLGMISNPNGKPTNARCLRWARSLVSAGHWVIIPEIADYEARRELLRLGRAKGLARLDLLEGVFYYAPPTTDVMLRAAELWADARRQGRPTAAPDALDGDVILAARAIRSSWRRATSGTSGGSSTPGSGTRLLPDHRREGPAFRDRPTVIGRFVPDER